MAAFAAETLFTIGKMPITNTILDTLLVDGLIISGIVALRKLSKIPGKFQNLVEILVDGFYDLTASISPQNVRRIFPWFVTFFIFIILTNWSGLIPGFGTIGIWETTEHGKELIPFFRAATSDINTTLGLALTSAIATHVMAIQVIGWKEYLSRYFALNPIYLFVGILELVGELTKVVSLSFRLFGNVYAGEVVLNTIAGIFAFLAPLPFYALEVIVGLVQALVFGMLTMTFMAILSTPHHEGGEH
jgi:F-type H+-transporting ATPase subunit a